LKKGKTNKSSARFLPNPVKPFIRLDNDRAAGEELRENRHIGNFSSACKINNKEKTQPTWKDKSPWQASSSKDPAGNKKEKSPRNTLSSLKTLRKK